MKQAGSMRVIEEMHDKTETFSQIISRLSQYKEYDPVITETFQDFNLRLMKPSLFASELISEVIESEVFILAESPVKETSVLYNKSIKSEICEESSLHQESELDVTGSPLPCPFSRSLPTLTEESLIKIHIKDYRPTVSPVSAESARYLLSLYMTSINDHFDSKGDLPHYYPLWIICDGCDNEQTILMGTYVVPGRVTEVSVSCSGPMSKLNLKLDKIKEEHSIGIAMNQIKTTISARYDVSQWSGDIENSIASSNNLSLICKWSSCKQLLETPPSDSESILKVSIVTGNVESRVHKIYKELEVLQGFFNGLNNKSWANPYKLQESSVMEKVNHLLEESTLGRIQARHLGAQESIIIDTDFGAFSLEARQEFDFTDLLWDILKDFSDLEELAECFDKLFKAVKARNIRPMLFKNNSTTIAKLITGKIDLSTVEKMKPLQLLIEIGIEKLGWDFSNFFIGSQLTTKDQLMFFLEHGINAEESLVRLMKLYIVLEVITECAFFLKLNREALSVYTRQVLTLNTTSEKPVYDYTFAIPSSLIHDLISGFDPKSWKIYLSSNTLDYHVNTSLHITEKCPINWMPLINKENSDSSVKSDKRMFSSLVSIGTMNYPFAK